MQISSHAKEAHFDCDCLISHPPHHQHTFGLSSFTEYNSDRFNWRRRSWPGIHILWPLLLFFCYNRIFGNWYGNFLLATRSQFALELNNTVDACVVKKLIINKIDFNEMVQQSEWFVNLLNRCLCLDVSSLINIKSPTRRLDLTKYVWIGNIILVQHWLLTESLVCYKVLLSCISLVAYTSHPSEETHHHLSFVHPWIPGWLVR